MTVAARPSPLARAWSARWSLGAEIVLFLVLMFVYEWVRDLVAVNDPARPIRHALDVIDVEKTLGFFVEPDVQDFAHSVAGLKFLTTWAYTLGHVTGYVIAFAFVWYRRRPYYAAFRNWFWTANALALLGYWLFPLAPPRLTDLGLEDPTKTPLELGGALSWFEPFRNEFAAMPSMHVGYTFLFALTLCGCCRPSPWRWLAPAVARDHALRGRLHREPLDPRRPGRDRGRPPGARDRGAAVPLPPAPGATRRRL